MIGGGYCLLLKQTTDKLVVIRYSLTTLYSPDRPIMQTADYRVSQSEHFRNPIDEMMMMSNC